MSSVLKKADKLNLSLSLLLSVIQILSLHSMSHEIYLLSNIKYKAHQIRMLKCFLSLLAVAIVHSIEGRC